MMRFVPLITILIAFHLPVTNAQVNVVTMSNDSVVQIVIVLPDGKYLPAGTGFFVGDGSLIATAGHVYWESGKSLTETKGIGVFARKSSRTKQKFLVPITMQRVDTRNDLVLFRCEKSMINEQWNGFEIKPLALADTDAEAGEEVILTGFLGTDEFPIASRGIVAGASPQDEMLMDMVANGGQSGGPVISVRTLRVVGIVRGTIPVPIAGTAQQVSSGIAKSTKVRHLAALLKSTL